MNILTVYAHPNPKSFCHAILERFTAGLSEAGHTTEVVDLYAIKFDPVFRIRDFATYISEDIPEEVLEQMNLRKYVLDSMGDPVRKVLASLWLRGKDDKAIARAIHERRPRDVRAQWQKVSRAQGLAFIAPVFWLGFPAILKGWFERVFSYGDAYALTVEGWDGYTRGRVPLLKHEKALVISTTLFREEEYNAFLQEPMTRIIDDWGLRYPGVKKVEHVYFYSVSQVDEIARQGYLERAYDLGKHFADTTAPVKIP
jgi:NAD(P)H dehydrogenase (quinone)